MKPGNRPRAARRGGSGANACGGTGGPPSDETAGSARLPTASLIGEAVFIFLMILGPPGPGEGTDATWGGGYPCGFATSLNGGPSW